MFRYGPVWREGMSLVDFLQAIDKQKTFKFSIEKL
jgi:hypothetical protein